MKKAEKNGTYKYLSAKNIFRNVKKQKQKKKDIKNTE